MLERAVFIAERGEGFRLCRRTPGNGARQQTASVSVGEGDAPHASTMAGGDENRSEGVATNIVRDALLGWPDHARLPAASSGVGECQERVK